MTELITIGIPFYRDTEYLRKAIESVRCQTKADWTCIVCDDAGPCPESKELVESYHDPRIKYVRAEKNGGLAINWNRCISAAETDLVMLLHADDELKSNYIEQMTSLIERDPHASGYFCNAEIINNQSEICFSFPDFVKTWIRPQSNSAFKVIGDSGLASIMRGNYIMCPTMIYRKSKLGNTPFSTRWKMVLDLEMYANILKSHGYLVGSPHTLYRYRRHSENQTSQLTANTIRFDEEITIYREIANWAKENGWLKTAKISEQKIIIKLNLIFQILKSLLRLKSADARKFQKVLFEGFKL